MKNNWRGKYISTTYPQIQQIYFDDGSVREIRGVINRKQGRWTHLFCDDDSEIIVNPNRVLFLRITNENSSQASRRLSSGKRKK